MSDTEYLQKAIDLAATKSKNGDRGPFGAIVVMDEKIIAEAWNEVWETKDPTAHAEVMAIRKACRKTGYHELKGATMYASCEPCPMCLGAIYWARIDKVVYAAGRDDAAKSGFDDAIIHEDVCKPDREKRILFHQELVEQGRKVFDDWNKNPDKKMY
ncbi:MAG: nucleoside deaminase [Bacteroidales bacterium]